MEKSRSNWWLGLVILALGVILLLGNFGLLEIRVGHIIITYWPVALLLLGLNMLANNRERGGFVSGLIVIAFGLLFLGRSTGIYNFEMRVFWQFFWPAMLILLGISFLRGPQVQGRSNWAFMGGVERTGESWQLENGSYWAIMGGVELDLRRAQISEGEYHLNCNAIMGGVDITVPSDLTVNCEGTAVLGGVELLGKGNGGIFASVAARQEGSGAAVVNIYGRAFMGGINVKKKER